MDISINLKGVLIEMKKLDNYKKPIPFTIEVRNFSKQKKEGGILKKYRNATLMQAGKKRSLKSLAEVDKVKDPNHFENLTRNIKLEDGTTIKKINILFIITFNGKKVVY